MQSKFFKPITSSVKLSPFWIYQALCGASLLYDAARDEGDHNSDVRVLLALRYMLPAVKYMQFNYQDYQRASGLLEKYGYRTKWAKDFIDTTCGRQQLKLACKEQGHLDKYRKHVAEAKMRWYHIDPEPSTSRVLVAHGLFMTGAAMVSHNAVTPKPPEKDKEEKSLESTASPSK